MFQNDFSIDQPLAGIKDGAVADPRTAFTRRALARFAPLLSAGNAPTAAVILTVVDGEGALTLDRRGEPRVGCVTALTRITAACAKAGGNNNGGSNTTSNAAWAAVQNVEFLDLNRDSALLRFDGVESAQKFADACGQHNEILAAYARADLPAPGSVGATNWQRFCASGLSNGDSSLHYFPDGVSMSVRPSARQQLRDGNFVEAENATVARPSTTAKWFDNDA
jgi:hypothetical protein